MAHVVVVGASILTGCRPLDLDDCGVVGAADCRAYQPEGLACGLAHSELGHVGGSCFGTHDPARDVSSREVTTARPDVDVACPVGFVPNVQQDHESGRLGALVSCAAVGNAATSSAELSDLPAGSVCGLGTNTATVPTCEGVLPAEGECPPGTRLRWLPDRFTDRLDEDCRPITGDAVFVTLHQAVARSFCEVTEDVGCVEGECASWQRVPGVPCGLHTRQFSAQDVQPSERVVVGPGDLAGTLTFFERCGRVYAPGLTLDALTRASEIEPRCEGRPVRDGCPVGRELVCAPDWWTQSTWFNGGLCWCDLPGVAQEEADLVQIR